MNEPRFDDLIELYGAKDALEADRLVLLLQEEGVEALARASTIPSLPSVAEGHFLILVRSPDQARAQALIEAARNDGAVSEAGAFFQAS